MSDFILSPAFIGSSLPLTALALCEARLQADARWPWIVLIPRIADAREIDDLTAADRARLMEEMVAAGRAVRAMGEALCRPVRKLNLGLLGNITPQLHAHIVGRRADDAAWPGPVWGVGEPEAYAAGALETARAAAVRVLRTGE